MRRETRFRLYFAIVLLILVCAFIYNIIIGADNTTFGILLSLFSVFIVLYSMFESELKQKDIKTILGKLDEIKLLLEKKQSK